MILIRFGTWRCFLERIVGSLGPLALVRRVKERATIQGETVQHVIEITNKKRKVKEEEEEKGKEKGRNLKLEKTK